MLTAGPLAAWCSGCSSAPTPPPAGAAPVATAPVVRTDLTSSTQIQAALGYAGAYTISNQAPGSVYTALPAPGRIVRRGQELYEVDGAPVVLFYGRRPEWRALFPGVADGPDVAQLDRNLVALGYATPAALPVSDDFTGATAAAVVAWQAAAGLPVTGTVPLGQVTFTPGPLRVASVTAALGGTPSPGGTVLAATSPTPIVQAAVPVSQEYLVNAGDRVTVTLPDGSTTTPGVVQSVSAVATAGTNGGGSGGSGVGAANQASVPVTIRLNRPPATGNLDQAPVTVSIVTARAGDVLAVPVNALVALAGGGYGVQVVQGRHRHLVAVRTGLFSSTLVQVTGDGLRTGLTVEVPAS